MFSPNNDMARPKIGSLDCDERENEDGQWIIPKDKFSAMKEKLSSTTGPLAASKKSVSSVSGELMKDFILPPKDHPS